MADLKDITPKFRNFRLLFAREKDHPEGNRKEGYDAPSPPATAESTQTSGKHGRNRRAPSRSTLQWHLGRTSR
ncbi:hypothetical protein EN933_22100 [Mesorhizobium sp. M7A.F.Ca.US.001.01.1.1]|nr:hypothetical protein EN933_22100 [Mesorhizobium sp. M7A.F.Ca.US.001.01.1.1]